MADNKETGALPDSRVRTHFNRNVSIYVDNENELYRNISKDRIALLKEATQLDATRALRLLDVGCGCGGFTDLFLAAFPNSTAVGVDLSSAMLCENTPSSRKRLMEGDALALPGEIGRFDIINVDTLMHHLISNSNYSATFQNIKRFLESLHVLLNPQGAVMVREIYHEYLAVETFGSRVVFELSTLHLPPLAERVLKRVGIQSANAGVCFLTRRQWQELFEEVGFAVAALEDKPWTSLPHRFFGFKASGDLYYVLNSRSPNAAH